VSELYFDNFKKLKEPTVKKISSKKIYIYDFFPAQLHKDDFPIKLWKRIFNKIDELNLVTIKKGKKNLGAIKDKTIYLRQASKAATNRLRMSAQEVLAHEVTHGVIDYGIDCVEYF